MLSRNQRYSLRYVPAAQSVLIGIAKTKRESMLAKDLKSALKLVVGSCVSLGVLIDSKEAKELESEIERGD